MVKQHWDTEELVENWTLLPQELELIYKKVGSNQIGFAILLKYFQLMARFPESSDQIPDLVMSYIASQLKIPPQSYSEYNWQGRSIKNHRAEIRQLFGWRIATLSDSEEITNWLIENILHNEQRFDVLLQSVYQRLRELHIEPPSSKQMERLIRSAITQHETQFCHQTFSQLSQEVLSQIDILLSTEDSEKTEESPPSGFSKISDLAFLKTDPGAVGLNSFLTEIEKLKRIRIVGLPVDLFAGVSPKLLKIYRQRAATEYPYDLRRHPPAIRYTLMAAFCWQRSQEITDNLIELLTQIIRRIGTRADSFT